MTPDATTPPGPYVDGEWLAGGGRETIAVIDPAAGMVAINQVRLTWPDAPFRGVKASGFGSAGPRARLVTKAVHIA